MDRLATRPNRAGPIGLLRMLLLGLALYLATDSAARAHATLLASVPADGSVLEMAPDNIVLRFNEPVTPIFIRVIGPDGQSLPAPEAARGHGTELRLPLPPDLARGGYIVSYRIVSMDSHPVGGSFAFVVGAAPDGMAPPPDGSAADEGAWRLANILLRAVQNMALLFAAGGTLFRSLVLRPGDRLPGFDAAIMGAAAAAIVAAAIGPGVHGGLLAAAPASGFLDPDIWRLGASTTRGTASLVLIGALAAMLAATAMASSLGRTAAALAALAATASLALSGHSAATGWPAQAGLALHVATAAWWLGALWPLLTALRRRSPAAAAILVRRFSTIAVPAVALLIAAGIATALTRIDDPAALVRSDYGRLLLLKFAAVMALLIIAVINRQRLTPALSAGSEKAAAGLARNIRLELALGAAVLLMTAVLAHTPPPQSAQYVGHIRAQEGYAVVTVSRGRMLLLDVAPARAGANALTLWLSDADGRPLTPIEVTAALSLDAAGIEPLVRRPDSTGPGRYALTFVDLPVAGRWRVRVDALISDFEKVIFTAEIPIR